MLNTTFDYGLLTNFIFAEASRFFPSIMVGLFFPGTPQLPAFSDHKSRREDSDLTMSRDRLPYLSRSRAHAIGPRHLRVPSVRLSSVTDFRFATAFSPCGGAGLSRLSSCRFCVCFNTENERLPRVRIPIRFRGVSRASSLWAYLWARIRSVRAVAL